MYVMTYYESILILCINYNAYIVYSTLVFTQGCSSVLETIRTPQYI